MKNQQQTRKNKVPTCEDIKLWDEMYIYFAITLPYCTLDIHKLFSAFQQGICLSPLCVVGMSTEWTTDTLLSAIELIFLLSMHNKNWFLLNKQICVPLVSLSRSCRHVIVSTISLLSPHAELLPHSVFSLIEIHKHTNNVSCCGKSNLTFFDSFSRLLCSSSNPFTVRNWICCRSTTSAAAFPQFQLIIAHQMWCSVDGEDLEELRYDGLQQTHMFSTTNW